MYNRGFKNVFTAENRKPIPWKAIAFLGGVAAAQVILGSALIFTGVGVTVGAAILA